MARRRRRDLQPSDIEGLEYFDALAPLLARLKDIGTERDRAGNRQLFFDQYISLLLALLLQSHDHQLARPSAGVDP